MGLDITAYRQLKPAPEAAQLPEEERWDNHFHVYANPNFPGREVGLDAEWYAIPDAAADSLGFRAGSYSGYNRWREHLAQLAGYPAAMDAEYRTDSSHAVGAWQATSGPFWELINFADNEGVIGPVVAAKLALDFAEFDERAKAFDPEGDGWFYAQYQKWRQAFEMAADGGAVDFH